MLDSRDSASLLASTLSRSPVDYKPTLIAVQSCMSSPAMPLAQESRPIKAPILQIEDEAYLVEKRRPHKPNQAYVINHTCTRFMRAQVYAHPGAEHALARGAGHPRSA